MANQTKIILEAKQYIFSQFNQIPQIGLILGSGLGVLADEIENPVTIPYANIPHFPVSTVQGHAGQLVCGTLHGKTVIAMQGRFHFYEGYGLDQVVLPVQVMVSLGIQTLIVTNAAGGINHNFNPGDLMLITDHLNLSGQNPLTGPNDPTLGVRFPDMSQAYDPDLQAIAHQVAKENNVTLHEGVYCWLTGPTYETPAEIKMLRILGADAVGMSTVPEVIIARHRGVNVLGISCISNMAAGILPEPLAHDEVIATTEKAKHNFLLLVKGILAKL